MNVRAKFRCTSVSKDHVGVDKDGANLFHERVKFQPVGGKGNEDWSKYTPFGQLEMSITAEGAVGQFEPGKEYFLDFTPGE